jgi:hypothetical protein
MIGWLRRMRSRPNPTSEWVEDRSVPLVVDLDSFSLGGVALGERADRLSFLGPCDEPYCFPTQGVRFDETHGLLDWFGIALSTAAMDLFPPKIDKISVFKGVIVTADGEHDPASLRREPDLLALFGEPYWRDADEDETLLFYEYRDVEMQAELTADGRAKAIGIGTPPLLADAQQRAAFGVTKPWPPDIPSAP